MRVALVAAAVCVVVPAVADEDDDRLRIIEMMFKQRQPDQALKLLEHVELGAENVDMARRACEMLETHSRAMTLANDGDGTTSALIEWFETMADKLIAEEGSKPSPHRAKAHVLSARVKCEIAAVRFKGPGPWEECAKLCLKAAELSKTKKARYIADAAKYYAEWYPHAGDRQEEVQQKALETAKQGLAANPDDPYLMAAVADIHLNEAKGLVASKKKGPAKKALQAALDTLCPEGEVPGGSRGNKIAGAYNKVLAYAHSNKIKVKGDFVESEKKHSEWIIKYPRGMGWKYTIAGDSLGLWDLVCETEYGTCHITMRKYSWDYKYTTPDGEAGGDNTTGMARQGESLRMAEFSKIDKQKRKLKGRLNRKITKTIGYDIRGLGEDDEPQRVRGYYFKGEEHRKTYALDVRWVGAAPEEDGAVDFILENLREREPRK